MASRHSLSRLGKARLMDHAERHRFLVGDSGAELDRNEDQRQAEIASRAREYALKALQRLPNLVP